MEDPSTFDTSDDTCVVCGTRTNGHCFSHLRYNDRMMALCCPLCFETFQKNPDYYDILRQAAKALKAVKPHEDEI
jgi:uncharacterized CHY-type Zn-finger protein